MSHQLHCPVCATAITPENINIQQAIAICANCGAVFNFGDTIASTQKIKRRKIKQPDFITTTETDTSIKLEMPLMTTRGYKWSVSFLVFVIGIAYLFLTSMALRVGDTGAATIFSIFILPWLLTFVGSFFARQTIVADNEKIEHKYYLANVPFYKHTLATDSISDVTIEVSSATRETLTHNRYNLFAQKYGSHQDMLITKLPEETAFYTQQVLSDYFSSQDSVITANRLTDAIRIDNIEDDALYLQDDDFLSSSGTIHP